MELSYDDYLMHYGVKGMKWGVRKKRDSSEKKPERSPEEQAARRAKRKKVAIGVAAVVGTAAVVGVGAMSASKIQNGRKLAETVSKKSAEMTIEDAVKKMQAGERQKAKASQDQMFRDIQARIDASAKAKAETDKILKTNGDAPASLLGQTKKQQQKTAEARATINAMASKGFFDMAATTLSQSNYGERAKTKDTKKYGEKGAARIEKKVNDGATLNAARASERRRKGRGQLAKGAFNYATGKIG